MQKLKIICTFFILKSFLACEPAVTFNQPQPVDIDNLSIFPKRIQGQYLSQSDSSLLLIDDKLIKRIFDYDIKIHPNELDSNSKLSGNTIIDSKTNERTLIKYDGDSLIKHIYYIDTLFHLNYDNVVRTFRGYYFLNTRYGKESWEVKKVQLTKGKLILSRISTKLDIENLKEITETKQDTIPPYHISSTKSQFKKFVKKDGFSDSETFIRQK